MHTCRTCKHAPAQDLLARLPRAGGEGSTSAQLQHLKDALARTNDDLAVLRNQLEQRDAALELMRRNAEMQVGGASWCCSSPL